MADVPTHRFPAGVHDLHVDMIRQFQLQMEQMQVRREFHHKYHQHQHQHQHQHCVCHQRAYAYLQELIGSYAAQMQVWCSRPHGIDHRLVACSL